MPGVIDRATTCCPSTGSRGIVPRAMPSSPLFLPTARQTNWLLVIGFLSLGYALYLRYTAIEVPAVALACQAGLETWTCLARKLATSLFQHSVFGVTAVGAAILNLLRPSMV